MQVNWLSAEGEFLATSLEPKSCSGNLINLETNLAPPDGTLSGFFFILPYSDRVEIQVHEAKAIRID